MQQLALLRTGINKQDDKAAVKRSQSMRGHPFSGGKGSVSVETEPFCSQVVVPPADRQCFHTALEFGVSGLTSMFL